MIPFFFHVFVENNGLIVRYLIFPPEGDYEFTLGSTPLCSFRNYFLFICISRCYHLPDT